MRFLIYCLSFPLFIISGCRSVEPSGVKTQQRNFEWTHGAITRGGPSEKSVAIVFTGDEFAEGGEEILRILSGQEVKASFFLTGNFYRNSFFSPLLRALKENGHYLGAHSDKHLLYCDWTNRDSLLVTKKQFHKDVLDNYKEMEKFGIRQNDARYFLPPYEWYNDSISLWTEELGLQLINFTHGTLSHTDYTTPTMAAFRSSEKIYGSILDYEQIHSDGLNGFILLMHLGAGPERIDKFHLLLNELLGELKEKDYRFVRIDELLE